MVGLTILKKGLKKRLNDIVQKKVCGKKADVNENVVNNWKENLLSLIKGYLRSNIYKADKTGLFYDLEPIITCAIEMKNALVGKKAK